MVGGVVLFFAGVLILSAFFWWQIMTRPVQMGSDEVQRFVVRKGSGVNAIADELHEAGLIKSPTAFKIKVQELGLAGDIQAGSFELSPGQNTEEIAKSLTRGTSDMWVTILEGWRREEIAASLKESFEGKGESFDEEVFLRATEGEEGYLFPDTYLVPLEMDEETLASLLTNTFDTKVTDEMITNAEKSSRSLEQIIIMASLIEREAKTDESRKLVSGILWKRLDNDWPLQVDATLQYATGYDRIQDDWWKPPTAAEKEIESPYNTYKYPGLPPAPIASPSLSSIKAAIYPTESEYWYYLTDLDGNMRYGVTLEDHNQNIQQYLW